MKTTTMTILGIDPGTNFMGYGVIECNGSKINCLAIGILDIHNVKDTYLKLKMIYDRVSGLAASYKPEELAIEAQFYEKNAQSMLKLGRAQGVAIAAAVNAGMQVFEYEPRKIKLAITGSGSASKEQVARMLANTVKINEFPDKYDATDALAAAVCHHYQKRLPIQKSGSNSWAAFIANNPDRVKIS
ncbi:MAG: crossover junction endodeoxyribonuclease RuvC [Bacteroidales bacterium]|nr:crossover junction endodeoxyribonuclease RuvC [Bacteroidales bacterium]